MLEFLKAGGSGNPYLGQTGRLLRFVRQGEGWEGGQVLIEGLPYPTAMRFGAKDSLYISLHGAFSDPQSGQVIRYDGLSALQKGQKPLQYRP